MMQRYTPVLASAFAIQMSLLRDPTPSSNMFYKKGKLTKKKPEPANKTDIQTTLKSIKAHKCVIKSNTRIVQTRKFQKSGQISKAILMDAEYEEKPCRHT